MRNLLGNLRISTRIFLGFILVTAVSVVVSAMAHWALVEARENFLSFRQASDYTLAVTALERETLDLQRNVQVYSFTAQKLVGFTAERKIVEVLDRLNVVEETAPDTRGKALLARMRQHILNYQLTFESAREEVELRRTLVGDTIVQLRRKIADYFEDQRMKGRRHYELEYAVLNVDRSLFQYLDDPYLPDVTKALGLIEA